MENGETSFEMTQDSCLWVDVEQTIMEVRLKKYVIPTVSTFVPLMVKFHGNGKCMLWKLMIDYYLRIKELIIDCFLFKTNKYITIMTNKYITI